MTDRRSFAEVFGPSQRRRQVVEEARMVRHLRLHGFSDALACGDEGAGLRQASQALADWRALGLAFHQDGGGPRSYDPIEVTNFMKWASLNEGHPFWLEHCVPAQRRHVETLRASEPREFVVRYSRHFRLDGPDRLPSRLTLPNPLTTELMTARIVEVSPAEYAMRSGHVQIRVADPGGWQRISACLHLTPQPRDASSAPALAPHVRELYLRPRERLLTLTPRVAELGRRLGGGRTERPALRAFWEFLLDGFFLGAVHYDELPPNRELEWALEKRIVDCQLAALLLVAWCRAVGIPARLVCGRGVSGRLHAAHCWMEAFVSDEGWCALDSLSWDLSAGAREASWRDVFFTRLEPRMTTEVHPRIVAGPSAGRLPPDWYTLWDLRGATFVGSFHGYHAPEPKWVDEVTCDWVLDEPRGGHA
jgi:hypothetical protein